MVDYSDDSLYSSSVNLSVEKWEQILQDKDIFRESDILLFTRIYLLGGKATASEIAVDAEVSHSTHFNFPVVKLSKRILKKHNIEVPIRENGKKAWWNVPFIGEEESNNLFNWIMRKNLYSAFDNLVKRKIIDIKEFVPEIRIIPMSKAKEFDNKPISDVQKEFFLKNLGNSPKGYEFKRGVDSLNNALFLFQYDNSIIASARLKKRINYDKANKEGYTGCYLFHKNSIQVFDPIFKQELTTINSDFKGFNQSYQYFDINLINDVMLLINTKKPKRYRTIKRGVNFLKDKQFYLKNEGLGLDATMTIDSKNAYRVHKGSSVKTNLQSGSASHSYASKFIVNVENNVRDSLLIDDYIAHSASEAGFIVLGRSNNGRTEWKDENGISIAANEKFIELYNKYYSQYDEENVKGVTASYKHFMENYPLEKLKTMSLEEYARGTDKNRESFCYYLEYVDEMGSIRGQNMGKFGIYRHSDGQWKTHNNRVVENPERYWTELRDQLYNLIVKVSDPDIHGPFNSAKLFPALTHISLVKTKLCHVYNIKQMKSIPIYSRNMLIDFAKFIGQKSKELNDLQTEEINLLITDLLKKSFPEEMNKDEFVNNTILWRIVKEVYLNNKKGEEVPEDDIVVDPGDDGNSDPVDLDRIAAVRKNLFIEDEEIDRILNILNRKKNIILQGPPGTGKTFIANELLELIDGLKKDNIEIVQFHQSYSYEDFVRGFRPNENGEFELKDGVFYSLVQKAIERPDEIFCIIIDEINRGNLSKIFGELMLLIEADKRKEKYSVSLTYMKEADDRFYIPENLFIIGTMNTADRSLALVDYALRRRFAFIDIEPAFGNKKLKDFLNDNDNLPEEFIDKLNTRFSKLNKQIRTRLGSGFTIGHSYFVNIKELDDIEDTYNSILNYEIIPLLEEYFFDESDQLEALVEIIKD